MDRITIQKKIDDLFEAEAQAHPDEIKLFMTSMMSNQSEASKLFHRTMIMFFLAWAGCYAISVGLFQEGEVASFKVSKLLALLIVAPPLLGVLYYSLSASGTAAEYLMSAISECYKHLLPKAYQMNLEYLLDPPTIMGVERYFEQESSIGWLNKIMDYWNLVLRILIVIGALGAIIHVSYLLWITHLYSTIFMILSIFVGIIFWIRGFML